MHCVLGKAKCFQGKTAPTDRDLLCCREVVLADEFEPVLEVRRPVRGEILEQVALEARLGVPGGGALLGEARKHRAHPHPAK